MFGNCKIIEKFEKENVIFVKFVELNILGFQAHFLKKLIFTLFSNTITLYNKSITKNLGNVIFNLIGS